ncbi:MAG TPA: hypothetical protein PLG52_05060 [Anaerolineales bacterium]|nr:hypothetical protein [Anaerolineales bacterium]
MKNQASTSKKVTAKHRQKKEYCKWFVFIGTWKNIGWGTGWSSHWEAAQIALPCSPCSMTPPEINSMLSCAWGEDRLYCGIRAMLTVFEIVHNYINIIMLVKENFDSNIAPIRAWVAQMELDNMKKKIVWCQKK